MRNYFLVSLVLAALTVFADTPPPNTVKAKMFSGDGLTGISATGTSVDVNVTNASGLSTVNQGNAGSQAWLFNLSQISGLAPSVTNYLPARISNGVSFVDPTQIRPLTSADVVTVVVPSIPLAPLAATTTLQIVGNTSLASIDTKLTSPLAVTGPLTDTQLRASSVPVIANAGTNLNTSALALENGGHLASLDAKLTNPLPVNGTVTANIGTTNGLALNATLGSPFQAGGSIGNTSFGATQSTAANLNATVVGPSGVALARDSSVLGVTTALGSPMQNSGGSVTANIGTTNGLTLDATVANVQGSSSGGAAAAKSNLSGGIYNSTPPTLTNGQQASLQFDVNGQLKTSGTSTITGAITSNQGTSPWVDNVAQFGGSNVVTGTGTGGAGIPRVTVSNDSSITANAGTNLNTSALALEGGGHLASIDTKLTSPLTVNLPTNAAVETGGHLASIDTKLTAPLAVTGPLTDTQLRASAVPVSLAATPLPPNAAIETGGHLASIDTKLTNPLPVNGTVTANIGTTNGLALDATLANPQGSVSGGAAGSKSQLMGGVYNSSSLTLTNGQQASLQFDVNGKLLTSGVSMISGAITSNQGTSPWVNNVSQFGGNPVVTGTGASGVGIPRVTVSSDSSITANAGTNLNTSALALESGGHLANIDAKTPALGQALGAASVPVVLPVAQITALTPPTTVTVIQPTGTNLHAVLDAGAATVGAISNTSFIATQATAANLNATVVGAVTANAGTNLNTSALALEGGGHLASIDTKLTSPLTVTGNLGRTWSLLNTTDSVNSVQSGTWSVTANAGTNLNTSALALESGGHLASVDTKLTNGSQTTQIVNGANTLAVGTSGNILVSGLAAVGAAPVLNPVPVSGVDGGGLKRHILTDTSGRIEIDTAQSLPLPAGAATAAGVAAVNTTLGSPMQNSGGSVTANAGTNLNTSALALESGGNLASIKANQTTGNTSLATIATNTTQLAQGSTTSGQTGYLHLGAVATSAPTLTNGQTQPLSLDTSGGLRVDDPVARASLATIASNTGTAATDFIQSGTVNAVNGNVSVTGQGVYTVTASVTGTWVGTLVFEGQLADNTWTAIPAQIITNSLPYVATSSATTNGAYLITGGGFINIRLRASAWTSGTASIALDGSLSQQTVLVNQAGVTNVFVSGSGTAAALNADAIPSMDTSLYQCLKVQVTGTFTGTLTSQGSDDNSTFLATNIKDLTAVNTAPQQTIVNTAGGSIFQWPLATKFIRLRMTAYTSGTATVTYQFSSLPCSTDLGIRTIAGNGSFTTTLASTTLTSGLLTSQAVTTDIASAARTTTFTSLSITPSQGSMSEAYGLNVTAVSGTTPTMDCMVSESNDTAANFQTVYQFERITATGQYWVPMHKISGNRIQYQCVISGTTPSFTFTLFRIDQQTHAPILKRFFDRTIVPNTLNSTTAAFNIEGCSYVSYGVAVAGVTTAAVFDLQLSEDGTNYESQTTTVSPAANSSASIQALPASSKFARLIVSTAGTGETLNYAWLRCGGY